MSNNVIVFPKGKKSTPPQTIEEMVDNIETMRRDHIDDLMSSMIPHLVDVFMMNGIDINREEFVKDVSMVAESSKSLIYKYYGVEHPFHTMVDRVFDCIIFEDDTIGYTFNLSDITEEE